MTVELRRARQAGEVVSDAVAIYRAYPLVLFGLALLTLPAEMLVGVSGTGTSATAGFAALAAGAVQILSIFVATGAIVTAIGTTASKPPEFGEAIDASLSRIGALLKTIVLVFLLVAASTAAAPLLAIYWLFRRDATIDGRRDWWLALVPGALPIYLALRWSFYTQGVMLEGKSGWAALDNSADLIRNSWWRAFGVLLLAGLGAMPFFVGASLMRTLGGLEGATIAGLLTAIAIPYQDAAQTLLYYDLKARKEAHAGTDGVPAAEPDVPGEGA